MANSSPDTVNIMVPPSWSVAITVPIVVWFSAALNVDSEVMTGAISLTLVIEIVTSFVTVSVPSVKDRVITYELLVS